MAETAPPRPLVLIDTPIWQDYFRKAQPTFRTVNSLMDAGRVCCLDLTIAELLSAAGNEAERKVFQDFTRVFPILREPPGAWIDAAESVFRLKERGKTLSLRDGYLAFVARSHGVLLYTKDRGLLRCGRPLSIRFFGSGRVSK